jgi:hypothetical protein
MEVGYLVKMNTDSNGKVIIKDMVLKPVKTTSGSDATGIVYFQIDRKNARALAELEQFIIDTIERNALDWFGAASKASVQDSYSHSILLQNKHDYILKIKLHGSDEFKIAYNEMQKYDLRIIGVRYVNKGFSLLWKIVGASKIEAVSQGNTNAHFLQSDSEDEGCDDCSLEFVAEPSSDDVNDMIYTATECVVNSYKKVSKDLEDAIVSRSKLEKDLAMIQEYKTILDNLNT